MAAERQDRRLDDLPAVRGFPSACERKLRQMSCYTTLLTQCEPVDWTPTKSAMGVLMHGQHPHLQPSPALPSACLSRKSSVNAGLAR